LGAHAVYDFGADGASRVNSAMNAVVGAYLAKLGYGYATVATMTRAAPDDMRWFSAEEARTAGVPVETVDDRGKTIVTAEGSTPGGTPAPPAPTVEGATPAAPIAPPASACLSNENQAIACPPVIPGDAFCWSGNNGTRNCRLPTTSASGVGGGIVGAFPIVPGDLQASETGVVSGVTPPSRMYGLITQADVDAYCAARAVDKVRCRSANSHNVGAQTYAEVDCASGAQSYTFRGERRVWRDKSGVVHVHNFNMNAAVRVLTAQRDLLCAMR